MKTKLLKNTVTAALLIAWIILPGCAIPGQILRQRAKSNLEKSVVPYQVISGGALPVNIGQAPKFAEGKASTVAVVVLDPNEASPQKYSSQSSRALLPPSRRSMMEVAVEQELLRKGYRLAERSNIDALLRELAMRNSRLTSDQGAARLGHMLNVDAVLIARLNQARAEDVFFSGRNSWGQQTKEPIARALSVDVALRLVAVEVGEPLWVGSQNATGLFKGLFTLDTACADTVRNVAKRLPQPPQGVASR